MNYFASLFDVKLEREPSAVWDELVCDATDLYPEEVHDKIKKAYDEGLIHTGMVGLYDVDRYLAIGKETALARLRKDKHLSLVENVIEEMEWWACYDKPDGQKERNKKYVSSIKAAFKGNAPAYRIEKPSPAPIEPAVKVGRNDPCPCNSGKKYKKCCGA